MVPQSLPQPFLDAASHCLILVPQGRWTVAQIRDRVEGRTPASVALPSPVVAQQTSKPPARSGYSSAGYIAGGLALLLAATLAGSSLLRHHSENRAISAASANSVQAAQGADSRQADLNEASAPSLPSADPISKAPVPAAAPSRPIASAAPAPAAPVAASEKPVEAEAVHGEVAQQVLPQVAASARETIQGTVKVRVRVNVDPSGAVKDAEFDSAGPSKYFSRIAMQAAQNWKFKPPQAGAESTASSWILQFEFTRDGVRAVPTEKMP
jgi:TonB family protein